SLAQRLFAVIDVETQRFRATVFELVGGPTDAHVRTDLLAREVLVARIFSGARHFLAFPLWPKTYLFPLRPTPAHNVGSVGEPSKKAARCSPRSRASLTAPRT